MPFQTNLTNNLTSKSGELSCIVANRIWPKTSQFKYKQLIQDKNGSTSRRIQSNDKYTSTMVRYKSSISVYKTSFRSSAYKAYATNRLPNSFVNTKSNQQLKSFYAGAKFSEAPLPSYLPKPPVHWISSASLNEFNKNGFSNKNELNNKFLCILS